MRSNQHVPADVRKFSEFGGMVCPASNQLEMTTMPMDRSKYPPNWDEIAQRIKEAAGWRCENCGLQCRFPGDEFDTHKRTLTVAHINHVEMDCRDDNLVALCPRCHLAYDAERKRMQRLAKKRIEQASKLELF